MNLSVYVILILFGLFVILLIVNPNLSCFGKRVRSPFHPLYRKRGKAAKTVKTTDFGFHLNPDGKTATRSASRPSGSKPVGAKPEGTSPDAPKTEDYGFHLD
jgi:hypothetical protein